MDSRRLEGLEEALVGLLGKDSPVTTPGASDEDIAHLRAALAPWRLPADVETLYRWSNGAPTTAFAGRSFLSIEEMLRVREDRRLGIDSEVLIPLFRDAGGGRLVVEAEHDGAREPYVWLLSKDVGPTFSYSSLDAFIATVTTAILDGLVEVVDFEGGFQAVNPRDAVALEALMLEKNPLPTGVDRVRTFFPEIAWPESWLTGLGIERGAHVPRGEPSPPFDDLIARSHAGEVRATVTGSVGRRQVGLGVAGFTLSDGQADLWVEVPQSAMAFEMTPGVRLEVDVVLGPTVTRRHADAERYPGHPTRGIAVRWYPTVWR